MRSSAFTNAPFVDNAPVSSPFYNTADGSDGPSEGPFDNARLPFDAFPLSKVGLAVPNADAMLSSDLDATDPGSLNIGVWQNWIYRLSISAPTSAAIRNRSCSRPTLALPNTTPWCSALMAHSRPHPTRCVSKRAVRHDNSTFCEKHNTALQMTRSSIHIHL